jgi:transposase
LPGVGRVVAATVLAEAAEALAERDYQTLRAHGGIAPVTRKSGKKLSVSMRYGCNPRLRNALLPLGSHQCSERPALSWPLRPLAEPGP